MLKLIQNNRKQWTRELDYEDLPNKISLAGSKYIYQSTDGIIRKYMYEPGLGAIDKLAQFFKPECREVATHTILPYIKSEITDLGGQNLGALWHGLHKAGLVEDPSNLSVDRRISYLHKLLAKHFNGKIGDRTAFNNALNKKIGDSRISKFNSKIEHYSTTFKNLVNE